jgi:uncharacterized protein with GYD domain
VPTYVSLINWTDQGIKNYRDTVARAEAFRDMASQGGGQLREILWTLGEYDIVAVVDAPNDETVVGLLLQTAQLGNVRSKTMRAMNADEIGSIISRMS